MSSDDHKSHVLMIFNQLTSYLEDVLKSYILNEILLVATSINFYSLCIRRKKEVFMQREEVLSRSEDVINRSEEVIKPKLDVILGMIKILQELVKHLQVNFRVLLESSMCLWEVVCSIPQRSNLIVKRET